MGLAASQGQKPENQHQGPFGLYLAAIAKYAEDSWGIAFESVEPFNEPSAGWYKADNNQEGCHFDVSTQSAVISYLHAELDGRNPTSTIVAASDESYYDAAGDGIRILDGGASNVVAAYDETRGSLVAVKANLGTAQNIVFDLLGFEQASTEGARVVRWWTQTGSGDQYVWHPDDTTVSGSQFSSFFETGTVQTFEVEGVVL
ncbi:uncharacterized protein DNG_02365 [Cephalotrichum gorgonifer]|uniref:Endo-beta-1,6-galactanase-like domain-containing protein n=1 Tax=Cephalotrichum gorgonifer TaxID=2041049 RepID=A0AAE8MUY5_9PEZI|nr:uncharacterized protein DNG_02365 [Cephalotrichum gorgonifer]